MGLKNSIFSSTKLSKPLDLSIVGTDMHSHLIPGLDDGCQTTEESLSLIRRLKDVGFKKLITTPHIMHDYYKNRPEIILPELERLRKAVKEEGLNIELEVAAEYMLDGGFEGRYKSEKLMTFGDNYVLIELSYMDEPPNLKSVIFDLQISGYKIILAHTERYAYWFPDFKKFMDLKDRGVFFQINIISLGGFYTHPVKKMAEKLIDNGMVEFIGSDAHNKNYLDGLDLALYEKHLQKLINSDRLLNSTL